MVVSLFLWCSSLEMYPEIAFGSLLVCWWCWQLATQWTANVSPFQDSSLSEVLTCVGSFVSCLLLWTTESWGHGSLLLVLTLLTLAFTCPCSFCLLFFLACVYTVSAFHSSIFLMHVYLHIHAYLHIYTCKYACIYIMSLIGR